MTELIRMIIENEPAIKTKDVLAPLLPFVGEEVMAVFGRNKARRVSAPSMTWLFAHGEYTITDLEIDGQKERAAFFIGQRRHNTAMGVLLKVMFEFYKTPMKPNSHRLVINKDNWLTETIQRGPDGRSTVISIDCGYAFEPIQP